MTPPTSAHTRIQEWMEVYATTEEFVNDRLSCSFQRAPLYLSDVQSLVEAFDKPCGSCHPCTNYADETWRAAGRKPPHVYEWDEARAALAAIRELAANSERGVSVLALRKALGEDR